MPGVIMENGMGDGARTNHDREGMSNGANGAGHAIPKGYDKAGVRADPNSMQAITQTSQPNGINGSRQSKSLDVPMETMPKDLKQQISQLPPEITNITQGYMSLTTLLTRLAQSTHNRLSEKINELASMSTSASFENGNVTGMDDNSVDNIRKKVQLLKFAEETHGNWVKALVITQWSRISNDITKLVDLNLHMKQRISKYEELLEDIGQVKRQLYDARSPNPDLKTAVEVLTTGRASWMPDLNFLQPPSLTAKEILKSLEDLNTLLAIRINLHEYHKIPYHFRDYTIQSGRVTFRVAGEFEVDLTIGDEDPEKQFWFIDLRFLFSPAPAELSERIRDGLYHRLNKILEDEGLVGCYKFLHEFTLTHKITELRRQAVDLARGTWIETLKVEPLHRALSIQYWVDRYGKDGPRSWFIIGVNSGRPKNGRPDETATSYLGIRWFRDGKEVQDAKIPLELTTISTEALLRLIIQRHVYHIFSNIHSKLRTKPLYKNKDLALSFRKSPTTGEPELNVQLNQNDKIKVAIETVSGKIAMSPASRTVMQAEWKLNLESKDPAQNGHVYIENLRCHSSSEAITRKSISVGWQPVNNPGLMQEMLKPIVPRDTLQLRWFRRPAWEKDWYAVLSSSMSGDRWLLIEVAPGTEMKAKSHIRIPLKSVLPNPTFDFLNQLHLFTSSIIAYFVNSRELKEKRARYAFQNVPKNLRSRPLNLPALYVHLSSILPSWHVAKRSRLPWAKPCIKIVFNGISGLIPSPMPLGIQSAGSISSPPKAQPTRVEDGILIAHGRMTHPIKSGLLGKQSIDEDISFHPENGSFALRLRAQVGRTSIDELVDRLQRVERLVEFVQVVNSRPKLRCESVSLSTLQFSYSKYTSSSSNSSSLTGSSSECYLSAIDFSKPDDYSITFESGNPHIRILDYLTKILNSNLSFEGVATLIPITLPVLRAFETIETEWADMPPANTSEAIVVCRSVDQHVIRYNLSPPIPPSSDSTNPSPEPERQRRHILLEIRLFHRSRNAWWNVRRIHTSSLAQSQPKDEIDAALAEVWNENLSGEGLVVPANPSQGATQGDEEGKWWGMQCSAIAPGDSLGAKKLVEKVDAVMRGLALNGIPEGNRAVDVPQQQAQPQAQSHAQLIPQAPMQSQAQRPPQGTPNNNPNLPHAPMQMGNLGQGVGLGLQMGNPGHGQGQQMPQAQMRMQQGQMQGRNMNMNMMRPGMKPVGQGQNMNMNMANMGNRNSGPNAPGGKSGEAIVID